MLQIKGKLTAKCIYHTIEAMIALIKDSNDCILIKGTNINTVMSDGIDELFMEQV
jgi:phage major head subunit gpT-like protein